MAFRTLLALTLCFGAAPAAQAQFIRNRFGFGAGPSAPVGQFHSSTGGQGFGYGIEAFGSAWMKWRPLPVPLRLDLSWGVNGANEALAGALQSAIAGASPSEHATRFGASLDVVSSLGRSGTRPYLMGGGGLYRTSLSVKSASGKGTDTEVKPGWNAGAGLLCPLRHFDLFFEARWVYVSPISGLPRMTYIPVIMGLRFGKN